MKRCWPLKQLLFSAMSLFLLFASCADTDKSRERFINAIDWHNRAAAISNQAKPYTIHEGEQMIECYRKALEEAKKVDTAVLNRRFPGWGDHFQNEFIKGIELFLEADKPSDTITSLSGQILLDRWGEWYMAHFDEIRKGKQRRIS